MYTPQEYITMAQQASEEGAHVAAVTYFRNAAEETENPADVEGIVESAVDYAGRLKMPTDRKAVYEWAIAVAKDNGSDPLKQRIDKALQEIQTGGKQNGTPNTPS